MKIELIQVIERGFTLVLKRTTNGADNNMIRLQLPITINPNTNHKLFVFVIGFCFE